MKRQLNLILNGKGGVGKSFFAVNLVQFLKDKAVPFVACDTDNENSTLKRFHSDTGFLDLNQPRLLDEMFRALERTNVVVVDCRAASTEIFLRYFKAIDLPAVLRVLETRLTLLMPVNHEADSLDQIQRVVEELDDKANYIVIRNQVHGEFFALYDRSAVRVRLLKKLGGREITMTRMEEWLVEGLNRENLTATSAAKHESFYLLDRSRLLTWQRKLYAEIESAAGLLFPGNHST
jgi:cellulose biosynthesis protein BcsQ